MFAWSIFMVSVLGFHLRVNICWFHCNANGWKHLSSGGFYFLVNARMVHFYGQCLRVHLRANICQFYCNVNVGKHLSSGEFYFIVNVRTVDLHGQCFRDSLSWLLHRYIFLGFNFYGHCFRDSLSWLLQISGTLFLRRLFSGFCFSFLWLT